MAKVRSTTKACTRCGSNLPATLEFFYKHRAGLKSRCKRCIRSTVAAYMQSAAAKTKAAACRARPENREKRRIYQSEYRRNPESRAKKRAYTRKYRLERIARDRAFRFKEHIKANIRTALKGRMEHSKRPLWWEKPCGYTVVELRQHLERQFTDDMSWDNHGVAWEIDHIKPLASFVIPDARCADFKEAWALSNLRPLLKHLNRAKGASFLEASA